MLSFIIPIYIDNVERSINLQNSIEYYSNFLKDYINTEIILVEINKQQVEVNFNFNVKYIFYKDKNNFYRKTLSYNLGAKLASGDYFCFLDADVFVNAKCIERVIENLKKTPGFSLGYTGVAVYTTKNGKNKIVNNAIKDWSNVGNVIDLNNLKTYYTTPDYIVGNTKAVGGCLLCDRKSFFDINGFNPNFIGWGYEDNEIISRIRILGLPIFAPTGDENLLIHAWHDVENKDKSKHVHYSNNEQEVRKVEAMNKNELKEYIKTWTV